MSYPNLSASEFQTLVLIYAAHADYEYTDAEETLILSLSNVQDYSAMLQIFNDSTDYNILKIILENKSKLCNTDLEKNKLYDLIKTVFLADGDYSRPEKVFLEFLDRMIKT